MPNIFELKSPVGDKLRFDSMQVDERLGRLFEYRLNAVSDNGDLKPDALLGKLVNIKMSMPEFKERHFNGHCVRIQRGLTQGPFYSYQLVLRPWLWFLTRKIDCRVFQEKTAPDIIKKVFEDEGTNVFEMRLAGKYRTWDYCVQYRESHFDFVSRLMEQEGIYYFFEHSDGQHKLILADAKGAHRPIEKPRVPYLPDGASVRSQSQYIRNWNEDREIQSTIYALDEYDFEKPSNDMRVAKRPENPPSADRGDEIYFYPGEYDDRAEGEHYAAARIEELQSLAQAFTATGIAYGISAGSKFTLIDHPHPDFNREYTVVGAQMQLVEAKEVSGQGEGTSIDMTFQSISAKQQFRPERITPRPLIHGVQTAEVVGPAGEEIYTDKYGRIKVQFKWDRQGQKNEKSSCWIRVAMPWANSGFGSISIPRIGSEVVVTFLEGDPDRPLVTGSVYNGDNMPPYGLPGSASQAGFKTKSTKGGGGGDFNELRFEDKKDNEEVFLQAQRDYKLHIKRDYIQDVKRDAHFTVERDAMVTVNRRLHLNVKSDQMMEMTGSISMKGQEFLAKVDQRLNGEAGQEIHLKSGLTATIEAGVNLTLKVGGNFININPAGVFIQGTLVMLNSGGAAGSGTGASPRKPTDATKGTPGADIGSKPPLPARPAWTGKIATGFSGASSSGSPMVAA